MCEKAFDAGVTLVEVPLTGDLSLASLEAAVEAGRRRSGVSVGAGTVLTPEHVRTAINLGAQFTVAPGVHREAIAVSMEAGLPHLPGVATSTDIADALSFGYEWLKAFPAAQLGPDWVAAQHGPFPAVKFVATGGVTAENADRFLEHGCSAVALGSALANPDAIDRITSLT